MLAIENANRLNISHLWLETDSQLVSQAFQTSHMVPWSLRNRWLNCLVTSRSMSLVVSHIYREGNSCADRLANVGLSSPLNLFVWWNFVPGFLMGEYMRNRLGLPNYRFIVH